MRPFPKIHNERTLSPMAMISLTKAANRLLENDNILILCHRYPDGDTIGSAFALCRALRSKGKKANVICGDIMPPKYRYMFDDIEPQDMRERFIVAVDVATPELLGVLEKDYGKRVDLCIDHHGTNTGYAKETYVDKTASAAGEIVFRMLPILGVELTEKIAVSLYTAISTDTGCFRYSNVTAKTHRIAAKLIETGINAYRVNQAMFETKSHARIKLERGLMESLTMKMGGRVAIITLTEKMVNDAKACESDIEGLSAIPRKIEGVEAGFMLREVKDGVKISARTVPGIDASAICEQLGGGGHPAAAGGFVRGSVEEAFDAVLEAAEKVMGE